MKLGKGLIIFSIFMCIASLGYSFDKVIYGDDDRLDPMDVTNTLYLELAKSTAAMIPSNRLSLDQDTRGVFNIKGSTLSSRNICETARFAKQMTAANCSGFLVGPDLIVTAGHCMRSKANCDSNRWVFGFALDSDDDSYKAVGKENVYNCVEIIEQALDRETKDDFALIRLDRPVTGVRALSIRTEGRVEDETPLVVIGHPTGLPTKIADGANVRNNTNNYFFNANLDTFGGNSGSAVFNAETGIVEGILVRGEVDYVYDRDQRCRVPKQCDNDDCRGEDVTRITNIKKLMEIISNNEI